jgi:hypothetical protein
LVVFGVGRGRDVLPGEDGREERALAEEEIEIGGRGLVERLVAAGTVDESGGGCGVAEGSGLGGSQGLSAEPAWGCRGESGGSELAEVVAAGEHLQRSGYSVERSYAGQGIRPRLRAIAVMAVTVACYVALLEFALERTTKTKAEGLP